MKEITCLIPTSPISSHPSTAIIEKCIASVREHLPDSEIRVLADGVRPEQEQYSQSYVIYLCRLLELANRFEMWIHAFPSFHHQAAMLREELKTVETPLILFCEHDTFFLDDLPIDFSGISKVILAGHANVVQFHCQWEPWIIPEHEYLMLDKERNYFEGVPMVRTWQFSARPHVASTEFYRQILDAYFSKDCRTMIEDRMAEVIMQTRAVAGDEGWQAWRLMYYAPEGETIRRTWTDDGRDGDPKFPMVY